MRARAEEILEALSEAAQLSPEAAIERLTYVRRGESPAPPLYAAIAAREAVIPRLLEEVALSAAEVLERFRRAPSGTSYQLHCLALDLLGLFEEPRAWPHLAALIASDDEDLDAIIGDGITESLPGILARCYDGSGLTPLLEIIENEARNEFLRDACLKAYIGLVIKDRVERKPLVDLMIRLLDRIGQESDPMWVSLLVTDVATLQEPPLQDRILALVSDGLRKDAGPFSGFFVDRDDLESYYALDEAERLEEVIQPSYFDELVERTCSWAWFSEREETDERPLDAAEVAFDDWLSGTYIRETRKVGRNDPCTCGSGRKYKKCCLEADERLSRRLN